MSGKVFGGREGGKKELEVGGGISYVAIFVVEYGESFIINKFIVWANGQQSSVLLGGEWGVRISVRGYERVLCVREPRTVPGILQMAAAELALSRPTPLTPGHIGRARTQFRHRHC